MSKYDKHKKGERNVHKPLPPNVQALVNILEKSIEGGVFGLESSLYVSPTEITDDDYFETYND